MGCAKGDVVLLDTVLDIVLSQTRMDQASIQSLTWFTPPEMLNDGKIVQVSLNTISQSKAISCDIAVLPQKQKAILISGTHRAEYKSIVFKLSLGSNDGFLRFWKYDSDDKNLDVLFSMPFSKSKKPKAGHAWITTSGFQSPPRELDGARLAWIIASMHGDIFAWSFEIQKDFQSSSFFFQFESFMNF